MWFYEARARRRGGSRIAGVDEAGRGPLAGPVVAGAVILNPDDPIDGLNDSKRLSPKRREQLFAQIQARALAVGVGIVGPERIDQINILQATKQAMREALDHLPVAGVEADYVLLDALTLPNLLVPQEGIVGGDGKSNSIAAASIIAKVTRDRLMVQYDVEYPGYGFSGHKGYPTVAHKQAVAQLGPCPIHRRTFRGVSEFVTDTPRYGEASA